MGPSTKGGGVLMSTHARTQTDVGVTVATGTPTLSFGGHSENF